MPYRIDFENYETAPAPAQVVTISDFLSDNFATVTMPGRMKTPTGYTEPFNVHLRTA